MEFNSKFNIGDEVWATSMFDKNYIFHGIIEEIAWYGNYSKNTNFSFVYTIKILEFFDGNTREKITDEYLTEIYKYYITFEDYIYKMQEEAQLVFDAFKQFNKLVIN